MSVWYSSCFLNSRNYKLPERVSNVIKFGFLHREKCWKHSSRRFSRQILQEKEVAKDFVPFKHALKWRKEEAKRSILVQVQSAQSYKELHSYCSSLGTVKQMLHYCVGMEPMHFIIVEFSQESDVINVLSTSSHIEDSQVVPVNSQFLWFKASSKMMLKLKPSQQARLHLENGNIVLKDIDMKERLRGCENMSDQMGKLHELTKLNDVGSRLRFIVARQVEMAVSGMFPKAEALPFGSSMNGFGKMGCDLDLVVRLNDNAKDLENSRLIFHCKAQAGSDRTNAQRQMEAIGDLLQLFLPGCTQVRRILQARVPIIKYYQQLADIECDLSMANLSGVHMSDFLYIMGSIDDRVRPLVFTVRRWACDVGLTNFLPGRWITNFSLTLLVLAFLQKPLMSLPVLPSLNTLVKSASSEDVYITEDGINCTFLRDVSNLDFKSKNTDSSQELLKQFFEYYSQFDYTSKALCLNEGIPITKPDHSALYIVNPLERGLNVSKNVSLEELDKFKLEVRNAAWLLESEDSSKLSKWGVLSLFENKRKGSLSASSNFQRTGKLLQVSKLFDDKEDAANEKEVVIKNSSVSKEIDNIRRETAETLKNIETVDSKVAKNRHKSRR